MDHVAIDLGGRESQICIRNASGAIIKEQRVLTKNLKTFCEKLEPSRIVLETCSEAFAVAVAAKEAGHDVRVVAATLVKALGVGERRVKTDQRHARNLSEASVRMELRSVHVPTPASREVKSACGMREAAVQARTALINNVRGWLRGEILSVRTGAVETFPKRVRETLAAENK